MGFIDNLGRVASTYMDEKQKLQEGTEKRMRPRAGHAFWPHEVLRDAILFASILSTLLFYAWFIPPPLHSAADPFAQAGFVFPDWYVLFSYGYLRIGEYLPQFDVPLGPIGDIFGTPVFSWNAAWWGAALTGIPIGILALPPFLGGREKRGVEDPGYAAAGAIYLGHIWFISVFSINIFLELFAKNRSDYCKLDSHGDLLCGSRDGAWLAISDIFNAVPWIMTGILIWIMIYFGGRWFFVKGLGARFTPARGKQLIVAGLLLSTAACVATWPVYNNGFWDAKGLLTIDNYEELEAMRSQPGDIHVHESTIFLNETACEYIDAEDLLVPAACWTQWNIYQPAQTHIIDFANSNLHRDPATQTNTVAIDTSYSGTTGYRATGTMTVTDEYWQETITGVEIDFACAYRTGADIRSIDGIPTTQMIDAELTVIPPTGAPIVLDDCAALTLTGMPAGAYDWTYEVTSTGALAANASIPVITTMDIQAHQPLLIYDDGTSHAGQAVNLTQVAALQQQGAEVEPFSLLENPTYHVNPKVLDAKLMYTLFIPCLTLGAVVWVLMRSMARGYEFEMNKCYGCDLCDDACPVRLFNAGDKLNIIYNTWNNEDDGVPMYSCLTCSACTNACPQLVDYDSYVDIRRNLIVGGAPQAEIPHTVLQAVLAAEAEAEADDDFIAVEDYPIDSNIGYYPGCVDYIDQEMVFSHINQGSMDLGASTTAAFTLFETMDADVTYLGRDFLKCCGHDQKWQGMTEVFEKLKAYNQKRIEASGIDTLVSSCAECFRTFARDYELEGVKVMHTTEFLTEHGFDMNLAADEETTVTYHDPCRLGRQMGIYEEPRDLINKVENIRLVEMEHHGEDAMCCGVSSMMSCNENARTLRLERFEEVRDTGADVMLTSCPKCVSHFECLKFEGDPKHDIEILDVVTFLARQVEAKRGSDAVTVHAQESVEA